MRVAIPLFEGNVAPRFGFADRMLVATIEDGKVVDSETHRFTPGGWHRRISRLVEDGVSVLLCGGFNCRFVPLAEDLGLEVIAGLSGSAAALVEAFARGEEMKTTFCTGGRHAWKKRNRAGRRGSQNGWRVRKMPTEG